MPEIEALLETSIIGEEAFLVVEAFVALVKQTSIPYGGGPSTAVFSSPDPVLVAFFATHMSALSSAKVH